MRRDRVTRALTRDGKFRIVVTNATASALDGQKKHQLDAYSAYFLGQGLSIAAALASFLKGEERISLQFNCDGIIRSLFAESLQVGEVRGFVQLADDAEISSSIDKDSLALGSGTLKVSKILYNKYEPITSIVAMLPESTAKTVAAYLAYSEQIPSAVAVDVMLDKKGLITFAGALIAQAMPGVEAEDIYAIEKAMAAMPRLSELAYLGKEADDIIHLAIGRDFEIVNSTPVDFFCRCSIDRFKTMLSSLGISELLDMRRKRQDELICQYCNKHYYLSENDFDELLTALKAKEN